MKLFWFFRIGSNLVAVGRTGCFGAFFLLFNLPVLLTVVGVGALFAWRMSQFPLSLVVGCGLIILLEAAIMTAVIASHGGTRRRGVFAQADELRRQSTDVVGQQRKRDHAYFRSLRQNAERDFEDRERERRRRLKRRRP